MGEETLEIERVNSKFYGAFESLSIEKMEEVWSHTDDTVCVHPGWDLFNGWLAIRESWLRIFENTDSIRFVITNTRTRVVGDLAIVVCLENIESIVDGETIKFGVVATNIFERRGNRWLMTHHHGSTLSNYLLPNVSN
jgi:ketosteroid isomerase-like protein